MKEFDIRFLPMTLMVPDWVDEVPCLSVAVHEYVPASFLVTLAMTKVPLSNTLWRCSRGRPTLSGKKLRKKLRFII